MTALEVEPDVSMDTGVKTNMREWEVRVSPRGYSEHIVEVILHATWEDVLEVFDKYKQCTDVDITVSQVENLD